MTKNILKHTGSLPLDLTELDAQMPSLVAGAKIKKHIKQKQALAHDRGRLITAFQNTDLSTEIENAVIGGQKYFHIHLKDRNKDFDYALGGISDEALKELNRSLRSSSALKKARRIWGYSELGDNTTADNVLRISFSDKLLTRLSSKFVRGLSNSVNSVISVLQQQSFARTAQSQNTFSQEFLKAVEANTKAALKLAQHAKDKGLDFTVDSQKLSEVSSRQDAIVAKRKGARYFVSEKRSLFPLKDLTLAMERAVDMDTLDQEYLSQLQTTFLKVVVDIYDNVSRAEFDQKISDLADINVGLQSSRQFQR